MSQVTPGKIVSSNIVQSSPLAGVSMSVHGAPCDVTVYSNGVQSRGPRLFLNGQEVGQVINMVVDHSHEPYGSVQTRMTLELLPTSVTYVHGDPPEGRPELSDPDVEVDIQRAIQNVRKRQQP